MLNKATAAIILNRNLPEITDELGGRILQHDQQDVDLFVVENGSDPGRYSRFANIIFSESFGPARGINEALLRLLAKPYTYFWVSFNDARFKSQSFLQRALAVMKQRRDVAMFTGYWPGNMRIMGQQNSLATVSFFDPLSFVVSRSALEVCQSYKPLPLTPLWDSSNFSNHYNILGTALALYNAGLCIVADPQHQIYELQEPADSSSQLARGWDDQTWKRVVGPKTTAAWLARAWPQHKGDLKTVRDRVIKDIEQVANQTTAGAAKSGRNGIAHALTRLTARLQ